MWAVRDLAAGYDVARATGSWADAGPAVSEGSSGAGGAEPTARFRAFLGTGPTGSVEPWHVWPVTT